MSHKSKRTIENLLKRQRRNKENRTTAAKKMDKEMRQERNRKGRVTKPPVAFAQEKLAHRRRVAKRIKLRKTQSRARRVTLVYNSKR